MFKIGDIVTLKKDILHYKNVYELFECENIFRNINYKIVKIHPSGGLGFEGEWKNRQFYNIFFELAKIDRKEKIKNLYND